MAEADLFDGVKVSITNVDATGADIDIGPRVPGFWLPSEVGAVDGTKPRYILRNGFDVEIGWGVMKNSATKMERHIERSLISNVSGVGPITLTGAASLAFTTSKIDIVNRNKNLADLASAALSRSALGAFGVVRMRVFTLINGTATMTIASPAVVTMNGHGRANGDPVSFVTTGALPTGVTASAVLYAKSVTANTMELALTPGGASINTTGSQSGTHTLRSEYVPDPDLIEGDAIGQGAGGGGASVQNQGVAGYHGAGGGGGAGQTVRRHFTKADIGTNKTVSIGAAGTPGTANNNNATNGGNTTLGALLQANGGQGGAWGVSGGGGVGGAGGSGGTGDAPLVAGQPGGPGQGCTFDGLQILSGAGGSSPFGAGGAAVSSAGQTAGNPATGYGAGGSGAVSHSAAVSVNGGTPTPGILVVFEYCAK